MSVTLREQTVYRAAPDRVWAVLVDWERQADWMPDVAWVRVLGRNREAGARLEVRTKVFGVPFTTDLIRVVGWEPPTRLAVEHAGLVKGNGEWLLEPVQGGTRFTWTEELSLPPPRVGDLAFRVYAPWQRAMLGRSLKNLRALVEA